MRNCTHLTGEQLKSAGWTPTAIKRYLPRPAAEQRYSRMYGGYTAHLHDAEVVLAALHRTDCRDYFSRLQTRREKVKSVALRPVTIDLLDATREASRSAHRWRDRASEAWGSGKRKYAATCSRRKKYWYELKEKGIVELHGSGRLQYAGATPQGMAVYEYGDGGMQCLHSTLHPVGAERVPVEGHPETLFVPAKGQEFRLKDVEDTLLDLGSYMFNADDTEYARSESPQFQRERTSRCCFDCGAPDHIARDCPF